MPSRLPSGFSSFISQPTKRTPILKSKANAARGPQRIGRIKRKQVSSVGGMIMP
jgi:hypothetical protein